MPINPLQSAPTAQPGLGALLQALAIGGQPQGNISQLSPIFSMLGIGQQAAPQTEALQQLGSPLQQPNAPEFTQAFGG